MKLFLRPFLFFVLLLGLSSLSVFGEGIFEKNTTRALPRLLDFGAHKCNPCIMMAPIIEELINEYQDMFEVEFVDIWQVENKERATAHKIKSIPTQIFFDFKGRELWRHEGFFSKEDILNKWQELGFDFMLSTDRNISEVIFEMKPKH